jgi:hypothetical protein
MRTSLICTGIVLVLTLGACRKEPDIDKVPVGSDVQLTRQDGALVEGTLKAKTDTDVKVDVGPVTRAVPRSEIADVRIADPARHPDPPPAARFREVSVPATTTVAIRLDGSISSETSRVEDPVHGELVDPVIVQGTTVLPAGAVLRGVVTSVEHSGKVKGRAGLALRFESVSAGGETYAVDARFARTAASGKSADARTIGLPAAGGAVIGAILGGKKGAAIGAAAGGGAGTAVVLNTPGKPVELPRGTVLSLDLGRAIDVRVPLK